MRFEKTEQHTYRNHMSFLFAWVQNPSCSLLRQDHTQFTASNLNWKPRQRFMDWAFQQDNLQQGFCDYFPDVRLSMEKQHDQEGRYTRNPIVTFTTPFVSLPISPDATIIHNHQEKVIEVCCQPERKGNTSRYALQKSRLRAAIYSYAQNPQNPCPAAFIVFHRWSHLVVHEQNIEQEIEQIREAMSITQQTPYHFIPSCHWFCPHSKQCQATSQTEGNPIAWSPSLQNIVHNVWSAKEELSQPSSSTLSTIAHIYKRAFSENM